MLAEWNYLHSIPQDIREELLSKIDFSKTTKREAEFVRNALSNSGLSAEDYVAKHWEAGRYSKADILRRAIRFNLPIYLAGSAGLGLFAHHCSDLLHSKQTSTRTYRTVCNGILHFPAR